MKAKLGSQHGRARISQPWRRLVTLASAGFLVLAAAGETAAQEKPGSVYGKVFDERTSEPLAVVQVYIPSLGVGTLTNLDGRFMLRNVPAGTYEVMVELLGYAPKTITGVVVQSGSGTSLDVLLPPQALEVEGITVSVEREQGNASRLLDERRTSTAVLDAVGAQDIARSPDSDAADVAKRITGVTVSQGKYVYVRGLGERYSQTQLNGSPLPSPEPEKETVPLDLFPAEFLETLTTQKTYTPDLPGDFSGGSVNIKTKEFFDRPFLRIGLGLGANTESQFAGSDLLRYSGGGSDFLGTDDGSRAIPSITGGLNGPPLPSDPIVVQEVGLQFPREFTPQRESAPVNLALGVAAGTRAMLFGNELGMMAGLTYRQDWVVLNGEIERKWRTDAFDPATWGGEVPPTSGIIIDPETGENIAPVKPNVDYTFNRGIRKVNLGTIASLNYQIGTSSKISLQGMFNRVSDDESRTYFGANREDIGGVVSDDRLRFIGRQMLWGQLSGEHRLFWDSRLEWRGALARATRDEPGLRESLYVRAFSDPDTVPLLLEPRGESGRYFYSELTDDDTNAEISWQVPFGVWSDLSASLKVGGAYRYRDRDFAARRFNWRFIGGIVDNIDAALTDTTILGQVDGPGTFALSEFRQPGDRYKVDDRRYAGYGMLELPLTPWLRGIVGARVEDYSLELVSQDTLVLAEQKQTDVLPSVNLIWSPSESMNLRAAYSRTLDRPEFRELSPFQFTEATGLREIVGNPSLEVAKIWNADLRWDWFTRPGEILSVSGFYKHFDSPIEQVFVAAASAAYSFQNAENGYLYGVELDVRQRLDRIAESLATLSVLGNLMVSESRVNVIQQGAFLPTNTTRPLEGQSPWVVNAGVIYTHPRGNTELGMYFNAFGDRVAAAGGSGIPDIYEQSRTQWDFTFRQALLGGSSLKFKATDVFASTHKWEQSANGITLLQREFKPGTTYSLGVAFDI
jgi:outer membrane receptor protein involved in Fe transport